MRRFDFSVLGPKRWALAVGRWARPNPINYSSFFFPPHLLPPVSFYSRFVSNRGGERRGDEGGDVVGRRRRRGCGGERPAAAVDGEAVHAAEAVAAGPAHRLRGVPRRRLRRPRRHAPGTVSRFDLRGKHHAFHYSSLPIYAPRLLCSCSGSDLSLDGSAREAARSVSPTLCELRVAK